MGEGFRGILRHAEKAHTPYAKRGGDVLLSIDVQGAMKIKRLKLDAVYIFILPPQGKAYKPLDRLKRVNPQEAEYRKERSGMQPEIQLCDCK